MIFSNYTERLPDGMELDGIGLVHFKFSIAFSFPIPFNQENLPFKFPEAIYYAS